jgi:3-hydroxyacyl-CoA dehydrogenase / enoyl-CoA hydratase / 3-hydroxybutyryl-CoA epimerase
MELAVQLKTDSDRVTTITMDLPGKPVNTFSPQLLEQLDAAVTTVEHENSAGVIFASAKAKSFSAGADLFEIRKMSREAVAEYLERGQGLFDRISKLPMPTIAAINGDCLGGGFELALACRYRVAADQTNISIGLPEVKLGLIPAWGGTTRLPRLVGLRHALPILLAGKTMPPRKALKAGLVDEVVRPEALRAAAKRIVLSGVPTHQRAWIDRRADAVSVVRSRMLATAREKTKKQTHGNYPAPVALLDVVRTGYDQGLDAGLEAERRSLIELTTAETGRNLLRLFFLRQAAKKTAAADLHADAHEVKHTAVIGGGTMGAGIVHAFVRAGLPVRLVEVNSQAMSAALMRIKQMLDDEVRAGRLDKLGARDAMNRVSPTIDWTGLELADIVVEAVLETLPIKREVFTKLDRLTRPTTVLASNTSSLRIDDIAQTTLHPERVVGLHFFNPVPKMPLVEIVRGSHSDDASLATALGVSNRIGKTPVLVHDSPGFLVNRILIPYLSESLIVASEGVPITDIDDAMKRWGMPMGPFELLDEIGLDIAAHVLKSLERTAPPPRVVAALDLAMKNRWLGTKSGKGFYIHDDKRPKAQPAINAELTDALSKDHTSATADDIQWRLVLPMVNEAARVLEEGVTNSTDTIDLAMVLGTGFAPFRGGIVQFTNAVGTAEIVRRLEELSSKLGERFAPARLLRNAAWDQRPLATVRSETTQTRAEQISQPRGFSPREVVR